jgi:hypothetical protein
MGIFAAWCSSRCHCRPDRDPDVLLLGTGAYLSAARPVAALVRDLLRRSALDGGDVDLDLRRRDLVAGRTGPGGLAAYGLRRGTFAGRDWAEGNFMAPLIVPTIIVAIALYLALAKVGLLGSLPASCWRIPCSTCRW